MIFFVAAAILIFSYNVRIFGKLKKVKYAWLFQKIALGVLYLPPSYYVQHQKYFGHTFQDWFLKRWFLNVLLMMVSGLSTMSDQLSLKWDSVRSLNVCASIIWLLWLVADRVSSDKVDTDETDFVEAFVASLVSWIFVLSPFCSSIASLLSLNFLFF